MIKSPEPNQICCLQSQELVLAFMPTSIHLCNVESDLRFTDIHFLFLKSTLQKLFLPYLFDLINK